jgi:predicted nucleic acid-binding protein
MNLIVDASVLVKLFVDEVGSEQAEELFEIEGDRIAPDLVLAELGNAIWKKHRRGSLTTAQALSAAEDAPGLFDRLVPTPDLFPRAAALSLALDHPIYDCFYIALAEREAAPLVTADDRLLGLAGRASVEVLALASAGRR